MVFFESPHRLAAALADLAAAFGADRPAAVCRELTKTYEEVRRGPLAELAGWAADERAGRDHAGGRRARRGAGRRRGAGAELAARGGRAQEARRCRAAQGRPSPRSAAQAGLPKRVVFDAVVAGKSRRAVQPGTRWPADH